MFPMRLSWLLPLSLLSSSRDQGALLSKARYSLCYHPTFTLLLFTMIVPASLFRCPPATYLIPFPYRPLSRPMPLVLRFSPRVPSHRRLCVPFCSSWFLGGGQMFVYACTCHDKSS